MADDDGSVTAERAQRVGLCARCTHAKRIVSGKGSEFWMCMLSTVDDRFKKYPPLPMRACDGYSGRDEEDEAGNAERPG